VGLSIFRRAIDRCAKVVLVYASPREGDHSAATWDLVTRVGGGQQG
jgi:hypothetical protein